MAEVYTTSAIVTKEVDVSALPTGALTQIIEKVQNEMDGILESSYTVPFSTVPDEVGWIALDLAIARVIRSSYATAGSSQQETTAWTTIRKDALDRLWQVANGLLELHASGAVVDRKFSRETVAMVTAATPAAGMTILTNMDSFDLREYRVIGICTATSGSPTGIVKITGTLDERESVTEYMGFDGQREVRSRVPFQFVTSVDASGLTGGTTPLFALKAVRSSGRTFVGRRV